MSARQKTEPISNISYFYIHFCKGEQFRRAFLKEMAHISRVAVLYTIKIGMIILVQVSLIYSAFTL